jgi:hypothetical protein
MAHPSNTFPTQFVYAVTGASHTPPGTYDYFYSITNPGATSTMTVFGGGVFDVSGADQAASANGKEIEVGPGVTIYGRFTSVTTTDASATNAVILYF